MSTLALQHHPARPSLIAQPAAQSACAVRRPGARGVAPELRLTRRGRGVLFALVLALGLGGAWVTSTATAERPHAGIEVVRHAVVPGDTLWAVARSVARPGEDPRDVVAELMRINRLESGDLTVGQVLLVPAHRG
ncbi:LysM peptidoglycan-binding domain-containing protein [Luteimicrobium subarcticum]|uniref:LysM domain-containing protein n=1 Tax=Luteimicrobium subarcticum TaxID=620910 RepID=A0A2M8WTU1_9MICO|nr:LysM peptidoglycan-binding domain-containing protein [Luteimicrobium subarcticum]PJI94361.1 LysM domain-containing protein [Luteimicrobium subarcticum]